MSFKNIDVSKILFRSVYGIFLFSNILEPEKIEFILETTLTAQNLSNWVGDVRYLKTHFRHIMKNAYEIDLANVGINLAKTRKGKTEPVDVILFLTENDKDRVKRVMMSSDHVALINQAIRSMDEQYGFEVLSASAPTEIKVSGKAVYFLSTL